MKGKRFGEILKEKIERILASFLKERESSRGSLIRGISKLIDETCITPEFGDEILSEQHSMPAFNLFNSEKLPNKEIDGELIDYFSVGYLLSRNFIPVRKQEHTIEVAVADPNDETLLWEIKDAVKLVFSKKMFGEDRKIDVDFCVSHIGGIRERISEI